MNTEEATSTFYTLLQKRNPKIYLKDVQELVFRQSWLGKSYQEIANDTGYEPDYVRHIGSQIWQLLSYSTGKRVTKNNFHTILKHYWHEQQPDNTVYNNKEVVNISIFCSCYRKLTTFKQWTILNHCSLIATAVMKDTRESTRLVKLSQQGKFEYLIWQSLLDAPSVSKTLADIIKVLKRQEINLPNTTASQLALLVKHCQQHCCLVVLNDFETILENGNLDTYRPGYEGYGELLRQMVETVHQSCLVIIRNCGTEEKNPGNVIELTGTVRTVGTEMVKAKGVSAVEDEARSSAAMALP